MGGEERRWICEQGRAVGRRAAKRGGAPPGGVGTTGGEGVWHRRAREAALRERGRQKLDYYGLFLVLRYPFQKHRP